MRFFFHGSPTVFFGLPENDVAPPQHFAAFSRKWLNIRWAKTLRGEQKEQSAAQVRKLGLALENSPAVRIALLTTALCERNK
ncbi:hypothetical protein [Bradyrhizobium sp. CCBAU 45394]|uniref:hypothetical protein n=1 Tax=Bradyrhizobium sp. CCBAU 45394 TaxID=1325087 RepID=UPI00230302D2|nr:hypothetical protein [Bradyrhizobium sp. CCBAU 45394]